MGQRLVKNGKAVLKCGCKIKIQRGLKLPLYNLNLIAHLSKKAVQAQ